MDNNFPRRNRLDLNTPAEIALNKAMEAIEAAGADIRLTDALNKVQQAKELVSDYIDQQISECRLS